MGGERSRKEGVRGAEEGRKEEGTREGRRTDGTTDDFLGR